MKMVQVEILGVDLKMREKENTEQEFYTVTEAVQRTGVASHVLRYWEDELGITIKRTALGHRIYSEEDLALFLQVKALKEKGIQLKAIRLMLDESAKGEESFRPERLFGMEVGAQAERVPDEANDVQLERVPDEANDVQSERVSGEAREPGPEQMSGQAERVCDRIAGFVGADEDVISDDCVDGSVSTNMRGNREGTENESGQDPLDDYSGGSKYEVIPSAETDNYLRFEMMLRDLVSEAVGEQNEKLKLEIANLLRDELENLYIQLQQEEGRWEAAASRMGRTASVGRTAPAGHARSGLLERIRRMFRVSL